jgi:hypothetical protein
MVSAGLEPMDHGQDSSCGIPTGFALAARRMHTRRAQESALIRSAKEIERAPNGAP